MLLLVLVVVLSLPPSSRMLSTIHPPSASLFALPWQFKAHPPFHALTLAHLVAPPRTAQAYQQYARQQHSEVDPALPSSAPTPRGYEALSLEWQARLNPIRVEVLEGFVGLVVNSMVLTGAAHYPPLFKALPCLVKNTTALSANFTAHFPNHLCEFAQLTTRGNLTVVVTVYDGSEATVVRQVLHPAPISAEHLSRMSGDHEKRDALLSYMRRCPEIAVMMGGGDLDPEQDGERDHPPSPCPLSTAAEFVSALVAPVTHRYWFTRLASDAVYTFGVQYFNGTHITAPFHSKRASMQPQLALYEKERRRVTRYFNYITQPHDGKLQRKAVGDASEAEGRREALERQQATAEAVYAPVPSSHRTIAPFEAALASEAHSLCPAAFHAHIAEYREWHAQQVARLLEVRDNPLALRALLTTDPHPIRIIVSQANLRSGISDRTHGLLGAYLTAVLTKRVLLMADDWPDIYLSMQPSLQLNSAIIAPYLNHTFLRDLNRAVPLSLEGLPVDDLDKHYPTPVTWIVSIRGIQVKLLTGSRTYGPVLRSWGLRVETIVGCVYHSLWLVRLTTVLSHSGYARPSPRCCSGATWALAFRSARGTTAPSTCARTSTVTRTAAPTTSPTTPPPPSSATTACRASSTAPTTSATPSASATRPTAAGTSNPCGCSWRTTCT